MSKLRITFALILTLVGAFVVKSLWADATAPATRVEAGEIRRSIVARALVVPAGDVAHVAAEVDGRVRSVAVRVGDSVEAGDVLARVEPEEGSDAFDILGESETLRAPIAGVVLARRVEAGDALGTLLPAPQPLFEIADISALELRIEIEERDARRVRVGSVVRIGDHITEVARLAPRIEERSRALEDVTSRGRGNVRVAWAALPAELALIVGEQIEVVVEGPAHRAAALVPRDAVRIRDGRATVAVRDGWRVAEREVRLGLADDERVAVEGLDPGAEVLSR